jgi:hypothetical protein
VAAESLWGGLQSFGHVLAISIGAFLGAIFIFIYLVCTSPVSCGA